MNFQQVGIIAASVVVGFAALVFVRFYLIPRMILRYKLFLVKRKLTVMMHEAEKKSLKNKLEKMIKGIDNEIKKLN